MVDVSTRGRQLHSRASSGDPGTGPTPGEVTVPAVWSPACSCATRSRRVSLALRSAETLCARDQEGLPGGLLLARLVRAPQQAAHGRAETVSIPRDTEGGGTALGAAQGGCSGGVANGIPAGTSARPLGLPRGLSFKLCPLCPYNQQPDAGAL